MSSLLSAMLSNIIAHLQQPLCIIWWTMASFFFFFLLLLELDDDTINPKHNFGGSSALLLAQHSPRWDAILKLPLTTYLWFCSTSLRIRGKARLWTSTNHDIIAPDALSIGSDFVEFQFSTQHPHHPVPISTSTFSIQNPISTAKPFLRQSEMTEKLSPKAAIKWEALISSLLSNRFL